VPCQCCCGEPLSTFSLADENRPFLKPHEVATCCEPVEWIDSYDRATFNRQEMEESISAAWRRFDRKGAEDRSVSAVVTMVEGLEIHFRAPGRVPVGFSA
jgi:hypothetical protein